MVVFKLIWNNKKLKFGPSEGSVFRYLPSISLRDGVTSNIKTIYSNAICSHHSYPQVLTNLRKIP
jgi:hypothetical protein